MKLRKPLGVILPPTLKTGIECDFARAFTWKERVKILIGYTAVIKLRIRTQCSPGSFVPEMDITFTDSKLPQPPK